MGASHEDRRKERPHCQWGRVFILCEFGHLLAEVSSLRLVVVVVVCAYVCACVCVVGLG